MSPVSYGIYRYEHGLSTAEQRAADMVAGEIAAELCDLWLRVRGTFRLGRYLPGRRAAGTMTGREATGRAQALTSCR